MASIQFGGGITNAVGSHAGTTFARNKGGPYMKAKPNGTKPQTELQRAIQAYASQVSKYWTYTLSDAERTGWNVFASTTPVINRLGQQNYISGQQMFMKLNTRLINTGNAVVATAPASTAVGTPTSVVPAATHGALGAIYGYLHTTGSGGSDKAQFWVSPPMPPGRTTISSQLRLMTGTYTLDVSQDITTAYKAVFGQLPTGAGQRVFMRGCVVNTATGITSAQVQGTILWS